MFNVSHITFHMSYFIHFFYIFFLESYLFDGLSSTGPTLSSLLFILRKKLGSYWEESQLLIGKTPSSLFTHNFVSHLFTKKQFINT